MTSTWNVIRSQYGGRSYDYGVTHMKMSPLMEFAVGVHEFLLAMPDRFKLHPILHLGYGGPTMPRSETHRTITDTGWLSVLRPGHYVELYVRQGPRSGAEVEIHVMRWKDSRFMSSDRDAVEFGYSVSNSVCRCGYCSMQYKNPFACTSIDEEFFIDLSCPDSLDNIRKIVLGMRMSGVRER